MRHTEKNCNKQMFTIYYLNESDKVYNIQNSYETLKEAKEAFNSEFKGYIKKGERIVNRYK